MNLWNVFKSLVRKFVRDHIVDEDRHDLERQREIIGYCSACRGMVRNADGRIVSATEVRHHACRPRPTVAGGEEVN